MALVNRSVSLPEEQWEALADLSEGRGSINETLRDALNRGVLSMERDRIVLLERETKLLVKRKLEQRQIHLLENLEQIKMQLINGGLAPDLVDKLRQTLER